MSFIEVGDLAQEAGAKLGGLTGRLADVDLPEIVSVYDVSRGISD